MMPGEKEFLQGHLARMEKMPLTNLRFTGHPSGLSCFGQIMEGWKG